MSAAEAAQRHNKIYFQYTSKEKFVTMGYILFGHIGTEEFYSYKVYPSPRR